MYRLSVADVDLPSYFVATAAVELGFFKQEGLDVEFQFEFGAKNGPERLRDGTLDFFGGPAYAATRAFPAWQGAKLLCALSQYSYWFMAVRADLDVKRGDVNAIKGLTISSSAAFPEMGLRHLLAESGIDLERDNVRIVATSLTNKDGSLRGRDGIDAVKQGFADAYWGNGMRVALGESSASPRPISIFAAVTVRRARAAIILPPLQRRSGWSASSPMSPRPQCARS